MAIYEIPISPNPQRFSISMAGAAYNLRLIYIDAPDAGWLLDIDDVNDNPLICGIPLVTGADLLAQYAYLGIGGQLFCTTDGDPSAVPTFANLGVTSHLYFQTSP
jgi:hypothetical protein